MRWAVFALFCVFTVLCRSAQQSLVNECKGQPNVAAVNQVALQLHAQQLFQEALACLEAVNKKYSKEASYWETFAQVVEDLGDKKKAQEFYEKAIKMDPNSAVAELKLGNLFNQQGVKKKALKHFERARDLRPDSPVPYNNIGLLYMNSNENNKAIKVFTEALKITQKTAYGRYMVENNLAMVYRNLNQTKKAITHLREAIAIGPQPFLDAYINLAGALRETDPKAAIETLHEALSMGSKPQLYQELAFIMSQNETTDGGKGKRDSIEALLVGWERHPDDWDLFRTIMRYLLDLREPQRAHDLIMQQMKGRERDSEFYYQMALVAKDLQRQEGEFVVRSLKTALRLNIDHMDAWRQLAMVHFHRMEYDQAEQAYGAVLIRHPTDEAIMTEASYGYGASIEMSHTRLLKSLLLYRRALRYKPDFEPAFFSMTHMLVRTCNWDDREKNFKRLREYIWSDRMNGLVALFTLGYPLTPEEIMIITRRRAREIKNLRDSFSPPTYNVATLLGQGNVIRLAYLSADFNNKPVGKLVQSMFGMHSRRRFHVSCYSLVPPESVPEYERIRAGCDVFEHVYNVDSVTLANTINAAGANVMVDLNGYTSGSRQEVFAMKPVAVQIQYVAYASTLAAEHFNYVITDRVVTPPEYSDFFTEKYSNVPAEFSYIVNDYRQTYPLDLSDPIEVNIRNVEGYGIPEGYMLLCNFNHLHKVGPDIWNVWMEILKANERSWLWMLKYPEEAEMNLKKEAMKRGIDQERILFTHKFNDDHIRLKRSADLFLDTPDYNAHVSGLDALWAGLPLLSVPVEKMVSRAGASLLLSLGIPEMVTRTLKEYQTLGRIIASDDGMLQRIREKFAHKRDTSSLFNTHKWVDAHERSMMMMWDIAMEPKRYHLVCV